MTEEKAKQIRELLDQNIPREAVSTRDENGKKLSYLDGWYVIDRLNQIFGNANWGYRIEPGYPKHLVTSNDEQGRFRVHYAAVVTINVPRTNQTEEKWYSDIEITEVGYGDGMNKLEGKAHELALKESVTDAIKRAAKSLGKSTGLALYDKTQEFVDGEKPAPTKAKAVPAPKAKAATSDSLVNQITTLSADLLRDKKTTIPELKQYMREQYQTDDKTKLTPEQAGALVTYLQSKKG